MLAGFQLKAQYPVAAPHGGELLTVGFYRMEAVNCSGYLEVYLYTLDMQQVRNHQLTGQVDFHYGDSSCVTTPLFRYATDAFTAEPDRPDFNRCDIYIHGTGFSVHGHFEQLQCHPPTDE